MQSLCDTHSLQNSGTFIALTFSQDTLEYQEEYFHLPSQLLPELDLDLSSSELDLLGLSSASDDDSGSDWEDEEGKRYYF